MEQEEHNRRLYDLLTSKPALAKIVEDALMGEIYSELRENERTCLQRIQPVESAELLSGGDQPRDSSVPITSDRDPLASARP